MKERIELHQNQKDGAFSSQLVLGKEYGNHKTSCWFLLLRSLTTEKFPLRSSHRRCSVKKVFLKILQISEVNTCVGVCFERRSHWRCSAEKLFLKFFQENTCVGVSLIKFVKTCKISDIFKSTYFEEHLQTTASVLNKIAGPKVSNFIKKRLQHRCFLVKFAKFLRTPISKNIYERLLLSIDFFPKGCIFCETLLYCIVFFGRDHNFVLARL